jgi:hypothetical protein
MQAAYLADDKPLAEKVAASVKKDLQQQIKYYNSLSGWQADGLNYEKQNAQQLLDRLGQVQQMMSVSKQLAPEKTGTLKPPPDTSKPPTDSQK